MVSIASPKEVAGVRKRTARKSINPALRRTTIPLDSPDSNGSITGEVDAANKEKDDSAPATNSNSSNKESIEKNILKKNVANDSIPSNLNDITRTDTKTASIGTDLIHCDTATSTSVRTVVTADKTIKLVFHSPKPETKSTSSSPVQCSTTSVNNVGHGKVPPIIIKTVVDDLSLKVIQKEEMDRADQTTSKHLKREATETDDENRSPSKKIKLDDEATVPSTDSSSQLSDPSLPSSQTENSDDSTPLSMSNGDANVPSSEVHTSKPSSAGTDVLVNPVKTTKQSDIDVGQSSLSKKQSSEVVKAAEKCEEIKADINSEDSKIDTNSETSPANDKSNCKTTKCSAKTDNVMKTDGPIKCEIKSAPEDNKMQCSSDADTSRCKILVDDFCKSKEFQDKIKEIIKPFVERESKLQRELMKQKSDFAKMKDRCEKSELNFRSWITFANQLQPRIKKCYQFWREWKRPDKHMATQTTAPYPQQQPTAAMLNNNVLPTNNRFINATAHSRNTTPTPSDLPSSNSRPPSSQGMKKQSIKTPAASNVPNQSAKPTTSLSPTPSPAVGPTSTSSILGKPPQKGILGPPPQNTVLNNPMKSPTKSSPTRVVKPKQNDQSSMVIDLTDDNDTARSDRTTSSTNGQTGRKKVILNAQSPHVNSPRVPMNHVQQKHNQMMSGVNLAQQQAKLAMQQAKIQNSVNPSMLNNIRNGAPAQPPARFSHRAPNTAFRGSTTSVSSANHAPRMSSSSNLQLQSGPKPRQHISYQNGRNNWSVMQNNKVVPPPLPPIPASNKTVPVPPAALPIPPKFLLTIKRFKGCVQLSWKTDQAIDTYSEIRAYELFACQPTINSSQKNCGWKRIDSINAMALPMACTLTELLSTSIYFFTVRGRDLYGRFGPCSTPCSNSEI